jgi:hypothetical protein
MRATTGKRVLANALIVVIIDQGESILSISVYPQPVIQLLFENRVFVGGILLPHMTDRSCPVIPDERL